MARMSIDDSFSREARFDHLAEICGWSRRETVGCILEVWALCYDRVTPNIPPDDINRTANRNAVSPIQIEGGFASALVAARLGRPATRNDRCFVRKDGMQIPWKDPEWRDRVYISGTVERLGYLICAADSGSRGGRKSAESRDNGGKAALRVAAGDPQGVRNPSAPVPVPVPVPSPDDGTGSLPLALVHPKQSAHPEQQSVIDGFHDRYKSKYGTKPTWDKKAIGQIAGLLKKHAASTLFARMDFMFAGKSKWPPPPYTLDVFVRNIDAWVTSEPKQKKWERL